MKHSAQFYPLEYFPAITATKFFLAQCEILCRELEHWETPHWAAREILKHEILTRRVLDPNCGSGILADAARAAGYDVLANDIFDWGYRGDQFLLDFLSDEALHHLGGIVRGNTVFMNPPFKFATEFVEQAMKMGARKIIVYQRWAWLESETRRDFFANHPPTRSYLCGHRATSWRHDIPKHKRRSGTPTAHGFFVWENGHTPSPMTILYDTGRG